MALATFLGLITGSPAAFTRTTRRERAEWRRVSGKNVRRPPSPPPVRACARAASVARAAEGARPDIAHGECILTPRAATTRFNGRPEALLGPDA